MYSYQDHTSWITIDQLLKHAIDVFPLACPTTLHVHWCKPCLYCLESLVIVSHLSHYVYISWFLLCWNPKAVISSYRGFRSLSTKLGSGATDTWHSAVKNYAIVNLSSKTVRHFFFMCWGIVRRCTPPCNSSFVHRWSVSLTLKIISLEDLGRIGMKAAGCSRSSILKSTDKVLQEDGDYSKVCVRENTTRVAWSHVLDLDRRIIN